MIIPVRHAEGPRRLRHPPALQAANAHDFQEGHVLVPGLRPAQHRHIRSARRSRSIGPNSLLTILIEIRPDQEPGSPVSRAITSFSACNARSFNQNRTRFGILASFINSGGAVLGSRSAVSFW